MKETKYCECCDKLLSDIKSTLSKIPYDSTGRRTDGVHKQYMNHPKDIYDSYKVEYCAMCGHKLTEEELHIVYNYPAMPDELVGYKCSNCNYLAEF